MTGTEAWLWGAMELRLAEQPGDVPADLLVLDVLVENSVHRALIGLQEVHGPAPQGPVGEVYLASEDLEAYS